VCLRLEISFNGMTLLLWSLDEKLHERHILLTQIQNCWDSGSEGAVRSLLLHRGRCLFSHDLLVR
jgi:hypothetical protein